MTTTEPVTVEELGVIGAQAARAEPAPATSPVRDPARTSLLIEVLRLTDKGLEPAIDTTTRASAYLKWIEDNG